MCESLGSGQSILGVTFPVLLVSEWHSGSSFQPTWHCRQPETTGQKQQKMFLLWRWWCYYRDSSGYCCYGRTIGGRRLRSVIICSCEKILQLRKTSNYGRISNRSTDGHNNKVTPTIQTPPIYNPQITTCPQSPTKTHFTPARKNNAS